MFGRGGRGILWPSIVVDNVLVNSCLGGRELSRPYHVMGIDGWILYENF